MRCLTGAPVQVPLVCWQPDTSSERVPMHLLNSVLRASDSLRKFQIFSESDIEHYFRHNADTYFSY